MSLYNINNKLICGTYGFITACENYTPPPSSYILRLTIDGSDNNNFVWNLTPNALSGSLWQPWGGTQVPQSDVDAINSPSQDDAYRFMGGYTIYWYLGETYSPVSLKYKSTGTNWRRVFAGLYLSEEQGSSDLIDSKEYTYNTGPISPVTITLQSN